MSTSDLLNRLKKERICEVHELLHSDGESVALAFKFSDRSGIIFTDWTDWTLRVDTLQNFEAPEYFWPSSDYSFKVVETCASGCGIESIEEEVDEMGDVIGMVFSSSDLGSIWVKSSGGSFSWGRRSA
ncbi:hypothetical protein AB0H82_06390 [Streptomyces sp. NPDC050732]|uniref:hypothetical protein n=1 Tax=Streptomyces sp. NPDC050732 TaxID=3154632 RepID=UPI003423C6FA